MRRTLGWAVMAAVMAISAAVILYSGRQPAAEAQALAFPLDGVHFEFVANGFNAPVDIAFTGVPTDTRMFVVQRGGQIMIAPAGGPTLATPFLDIGAKVSSAFEEEGLLGLAFAPDYGATGIFYVYYIDGDSNIQLSAFQVSGNPNVADPTEHSILSIAHPDCQNHNGGDLNFGPDGYLYLAPGDGGGKNDSCNNNPNNDNDAQRLNSLLGKVLRINVVGLAGYTVPASNPFAQTLGARGEIWALGLRNPWRFSFDQLTGDMYIGEVGQDQFEEVDFQPANSPGGENYGWRCYEGFALYEPCGSPGPLTAPVFAYAHNLGQAISGGYVYRGTAYPSIFGYYFFADYLTGRFWARGGCGKVVTDLGQLLGDHANPSTWGQNAAGELFVADLNGTIHHLVGNLGPTPPVVQTPIFLPLIGNDAC